MTAVCEHTTHTSEQEKEDVGHGLHDADGAKVLLALERLARLPVRKAVLPDDDVVVEVIEDAQSVPQVRMEQRNALDAELGGSHEAHEKAEHAQLALLFRLAQVGLELLVSVGVLADAADHVGDRAIQHRHLGVAGLLVALRVRHAVVGAPAHTYTCNQKPGGGAEFEASLT
eukprot:1216104-Prymnesium_polylepis.2